MEILIYLVIFVIVGGLFFGVLNQVLRVNTQEGSVNETTSQLNFVIATITRLVKSSSAIDISSSAPTSNLKLRMRDTSVDPTCVYLSGGVIYMAQGINTSNPSSCATDPSKITALTTSKVAVGSLVFNKLAFPGGHDQVSIDIQMNSSNQNPAAQIARSLHTAVSRVSAATFDDGLYPGSSTYDLGNTANKWRALYLNPQSSAPFSCDSSHTGAIYYDSPSNSFIGCANGTWKTF